MIEAGAIIGPKGHLLEWHLPPGASGGSLPDDPDLWQSLWELREYVRGFAHSHPGSGVPGPSMTDLTTFAAIEAGLGKRLDWYIISSDSWALFRWAGPGRLDYSRHEVIGSSPGREFPFEPVWLEGLRRASGYEGF